MRAVHGGSLDLSKWAGEPIPCGRFRQAALRSDRTAWRRPAPLTAHNPAAPARLSGSDCSCAVPAARGAPALVPRRSTAAAAYHRRPFLPLLLTSDKTRLSEV